MSPQEEARKRVSQSQRLLANGHARFAVLAADIAVALEPSPSATRNRDVIYATTNSWTEQTRPPQVPIAIREAAELHVRATRLYVSTVLVSAVSYIPRAYRTRVAAATFILGVAILLRAAYGGALPLKWLLTGAYYNRTTEDGSSFTFMMSPSIGWILISALCRFFMRRPEVRAQRPHVE